MNIYLQKKTISEFAEVVTGGTPSTGRPEYWSGEIQWMSSGEVNNKHVYRTKKHITELGLANSNARILPHDSVMIALAGQGKTRGMVAILKTSATCNQSLAAILPNENYDSDFLYHYLDSKYDEIRSLSGGEGRSGLNLKMVKSIEVALPEVQTQRRIATILDTSDDLISKTQKIIDQTTRLKHSLMKELLATDGEYIPLNSLISDLRTGVSVRSENRQLRDGETGILKVSAVTYLTFNPAEHKAVTDEQKARLVKSVEKDTILVSRANTPKLVGASVYVSTDHPDLFLPDKLWELTVKDGVSGKWLNFVLQQLYLEGVAGSLATGTSSSMLNISQEKYLNLEIPVMSYNRQCEIADVLEAIDKKILLNKQVKAKQQTLKKGLMQDLLNGKVCV